MRIACKIFNNFLLTLFYLPRKAMDAAEAPIKLRVAYPTLTASYAVAWIAKEENIFRKHGLNVEFTLHPELADSGRCHARRNAPVGLTSGAPAVSSNLSGSDLVLIASLSNISGIAYLVTSPKLTSPTQLKGKIIGIV